MDDLDDLLGRSEALGDFRPDRPVFDAAEQVTRHADVHVRLEQGQPDLAQGCVDVALAQPSLPAQTGKDVIQPIREGLEHTTSSVEDARALAIPATRARRDEPRGYCPVLRSFILRAVYPTLLSVPQPGAADQQD